jgi:hypothetical protein
MLMDSDKCKHPPFNFNGLRVNITLIPVASSEKITLAGTLVDISYTGIRIKLSNEIHPDLPDSKIKMDFIMPASGVPVSIHGMLRHVNVQAEYGLQHSNRHPAQAMDYSILECIRIAHESLPNPTP